MNNQNDNQAAKALFKVIAYSPAVSKATGSIKFAVLWGQIKYWSDKARDPEGWVYKSSAELFDEIGMSRKESDTARGLGEKLGVMQSKVAGTPPTVHYLINEDKMVELIEKYLKKNPEKGFKVNQKNAVEVFKKVVDSIKERGEIPAWINPEIWDEWVLFRKESGKKLTDITIKKQIKFLEEHKSDYAEIIMTSIRNGWQGLFPLKKDFKKMPSDQQIRNDEKRKMIEIQKQKELQEMSKPKTPEEQARINESLAKIREKLKHKFIMPKV